MPDLKTLKAALASPARPSSDYDLNPDIPLVANRTLRPAGVLVPLIPRNGHLNVILTKRSSALKHHPGQIAFPGGKVDPTDKNVTDTALREAQEEIGLPPESVEILGALPNHETVTGFNMTPTIGLIHKPFQANPELGEVAEVFEVPLAHVLNPDSFQIEGRRWRGRRRHYFTVPFGPYYIWGATARILKGLADRAQQAAD